MSVATTIIFAREDLSIPGAPDNPPMAGRRDAVHVHFFDLVSSSKPDVIVLDLSGSPVAGTETILSIRERTDIPILVVSDADYPLLDEYRIAGAADCISAPIDILRLNEAIQRIMRVIQRGRPSISRPPETFSFAGMSFYPHRNLLTGEGGSTADLTSSEGRLLAHFVAKPWVVCLRGEIGELLYGPQHTVGDRAIDVVVNRLRKKLASVGGPEGEHLIKTEFRRGYLLVADVEARPHRSSARPHAVLEPAN
jgi:two-component system, OmpR family, response regulator